MPSISKIRFTNVIYEGGNKRYNDETFLFDGHNGAILLENGGGKTVFIQTALQTVLPHADLADRKMKDTLKLEEAPAHIAIEWILNDRPRRYALTCISLFLTKNGLDSFRYVFEYGENDKHGIDGVPFVREFAGKTRAADRGEIQEYYSYMTQSNLNAKIFDTIKSYKLYLEQNYYIIAKEWESVVKINSAEGGVEHFFDECKTTGQLFDRLLIPTVEESMTGFQKNEFAETFEKHRNSFKEYKHLKEKIAENERIKEKVEVYVKTFANLDVKRQDYMRTKEISKAYMNLAKYQQSIAEDEAQQLNEAFLNLENRNKQLLQKEASYEISIEKEKLAAVSKKLTTETEFRDQIQVEFNETDTFYYSLKLAEYKKKSEVEKQRKALNEEKLLEIDLEFDVDEIKVRIEKNACEINGYFVSLEEKLKKEQQALQFELNSLKNQLELEEVALRKASAEKVELSKQETKQRTILERNQKDMNDLQSEVLSNPKQETIEEQLPIWNQTYNGLDLENVKLVQRNKKLKSENESLGLEQNRVQLQLQESHKKEASIQTTKEIFEEEHQKVKAKLAVQKNTWTRLDSVYLKQDSIENQVIEDLEKLNRVREQLLYQERLAFRFVDDYGSQDVFSGDAYLSKQIQQWKNQFSYIETGVSYIQSLGRQVEDLTEKSPFWPVTLITTEKEKRKLLEKVIHINDRLQYPVNILSNDEASLIVHGQKSFESHWIQPKHWKMNSEPDSFLHWKETVTKLAEESKLQRQVKDQELQSWNQLQKEISDFFHHYPYTEFQEIGDKLTFVKEEIFQLTREEKKLKEKINEYEKELGINQNKINDNKETMAGFERRIEKGNKYNQVKKENETVEKELHYVTGRISTSNELINRLEKTSKDFKNQGNVLEIDIRDLATQISREILENRLYQKVKNTNPSFTSKGIELLEEEQQQLQRELAHLSKGRNELESAIQYSIEMINSYLNEINRLRTEKQQLNEDLDFPLHGTEKMNELWNKRMELVSTLNGFIVKVEKLTQKRDKLEGIVESMLRKVSEFIVFELHLDLVRKQLDEEKHSLRAEKEHLDQTFKNLEKQLKSMNSVVFELEKYDTKHLFLDSAIHEVVLSSDEDTTFTYERKKKAQEIIKMLEVNYDAEQSEEKKVGDAKAKYIDFCRLEITDIRMREMAIQGIDHKHTYDEVLKYKELLEGRIANAIKYAEQNIITHDQQLEQFIVHIHTHLKKIADELKLIPKKTSVKVEDQWKEIFSFTIPEWNEHEAKADIRTHINWILEQLDKETYKNEFGFDDEGKMKKDLEKWLQSKQLLQVVMKNQTMKVSCRKVTNDNKVTKGSYSWEQSNVWSGGEKWSKNMTLFLGILNYIAEKQQHIKPKMRRHRTVIVDNPFGKASSDHVLNPVFFIAEQLGFQIIALTAHAEGKFLRDYFPIIYSCRLRSAAGSDKQIMTKEKNIQHAYFQDHAPQSLSKLGEVEQMELF